MIVLLFRFSRPKGNTSNLVIVHTEQASARLWQKKNRKSEGWETKEEKCRKVSEDSETGKKLLYNCLQVSWLHRDLLSGILSWVFVQAGVSGLQT